MSRIGKNPIKIASGVNVTINGSDIAVKGKQGELSYTLPKGIAASVEDGYIKISRGDDARQTRAFHGLARALVSNMVTGVSEGYTKGLEIDGVGFKAELKGSSLFLSLGFANAKEYKIPEGVKVTVDGAGVKIAIAGISKELVGRVAADIRSYFPAEPYKGKGIRYTGEKIRRKEGKTVA